ncbi:cupin domain-containing protein [Algoriphagus halophilus]|uniref:cupin domain-containing protein n=1 Tax=Algoriphagus halophilus TaxID=226505 RepID=UPI00358FAFE9
MILSSISTYLITKGSLIKNESDILISSDLSWNGTKIPDYPEGKPKISILKITIPPGSSLPKHIHPVINAGVLIKGELFVEDEFGNQLNMKAGDPIIEVVNTVHYGENRGTIPAEIIIFYAGSEGLTITKIMEDQ